MPFPSPTHFLPLITTGGCNWTECIKHVVYTMIWPSVFLLNSDSPQIKSRLKEGETQQNPSRGNFTIARRVSETRFVLLLLLLLRLWYYYIWWRRLRCYYSVIGICAAAAGLGALFCRCTNRLPRVEWSWMGGTRTNNNDGGRTNVHRRIHVHIYSGRRDVGELIVI